MLPPTFHGKLASTPASTRCPYRACTATTTRWPTRSAISFLSAQKSVPTSTFHILWLRVAQGRRRRRRNDADNINNNDNNTPPSLPPPLHVQITSNTSQAEPEHKTDTLHSVGGRRRTSHHPPWRHFTGHWQHHSCIYVNDNNNYQRSFELAGFSSQGLNRLQGNSRRDPRRFEEKQADPDRTPIIRNQHRDLSPVFPSWDDCEERTVLEIQ